MTEVPIKVIEYGGDTISYRVRYADRDTLEIAVLPSGEVVITAPRGAMVRDIEMKVRKRLRWIVRQQRNFRQFEPRTPERRFVSGETHLYLGRQYRLKVERHVQAHVKLWAGRIWVYTHRPSSIETTQRLLDEWYRERARAKFSESLERCWPSFGQHQGERPAIEIRRMSKRWGSLSASGRVILNRDLIRAPVPCIDYVITHELCHTRHPDHGSAFYDLLDRMMPDWPQRKRVLEHSLK